jgi:hypothetical protein
MEAERMGLLTTAIIVFLSGLVVGWLVMPLLQNAITWSVLIGPRWDGHGYPLRALVVFTAADALVVAAVVVAAARVMGFSVSYALAAVALALGTVLTTGITYLAVSSRPATSAGEIAWSGFAIALFPLVLVLGILVPALLINAGSYPSTVSLPRELPPRAP